MEVKKDYCNICKEAIDKKYEYCVLTQFDKNGEFFSEAFYHIICFKNWASDQKKLDRQARELIEKTNKIIGRFE